VLSLGERQRVLIARALMPDPPLLILDEPCAGLDLAAREHLLEVVDALAGEGRNRTLVFVTHHVEEITPSFSHVLVLKDGRVHAAGSKQGVLTDAVLGSAFGLDIRVDQAGDRYWAQIDSPGRES
jgi:iron complex transport system ATP-binding protein